MVESEGVADISIEPITKNFKNMTYSELMKCRLSELQCFAEECSIELLKSDGKKKTKSDLSKDLIDYLSKKNISST